MPQIPQLDGAQTASPADTEANHQANHQTSPLTGSLWQSFAAEWKSFLASADQTQIEAFLATFSGLKPNG